MQPAKSFEGCTNILALSRPRKSRSTPARAGGGSYPESSGGLEPFGRRLQTVWKDELGEGRGSIRIAAPVVPLLKDYDEVCGCKHSLIHIPSFGFEDSGDAQGLGQR